MNRKNQALLILDMSKVYVYDKPLIPVETRKQLIANIKKSIKIARKNHLYVIYINSSFRETDPIYKLINYRKQAMDGTEDVNVVDELKPQKTDYILLKRGYDGFWKSNLEELLQKLQIKILFLTGCQTDCCVRETVVTASHLGYDVYVLKDCCDTNREYGQVAALRFLTNCTKDIINVKDFQKYLA